MALTNQERRQFKEEGYLIKRSVLDPSDLEAIRNGLHRIVRREAERARDDGLIDETFPGASFERLPALLAERYPDHIMRILAPIYSGRFSGPEMFSIIVHPKMLAVVEDFVGETIIGSSVYRVRPKLPNWTRGEVPWHQDSGYFLPHCDDMLILTCWIPLVDADEQNGCLWVAPRSHKEGVARHYTGGHGGYLEIAGEDLTGDDSICAEMKLGDVLFMTNLTAHASFVNRSDLTRWSLDLRYQSSEVPNNVGEDPASYTPERDPVTMACYPPEADFVIRDPSDPTRECRTAEQFLELRERFFARRAYMPGRGWTPLASRSHPAN